MMSAMDRRIFLHATGTALTFGLGASRALAQADPDTLVNLLEEAPRTRLPAELVERIRAGLSVEELLRALAHAAARNVQPYPDVGFKYHTVMALQSVHLTTRSLPAEDRWLPSVWAADYFKQAQAEEHLETGWRMPARPPGGTASPDRARRVLVAALDAWDREAADAAIVDYAPLVEMGPLFELLFVYGARDLREIGHKAITVQNAHRLIGVLGAAHAGPILRSTVAALLNTGGDPNPAEHDLPADRPWAANRRRLADIPGLWRDGAPDGAARAVLLQALRDTSEDEAGQLIVDALQQGVAPAAIWEAMFAAAAELVMRDPGIVPVHALTTANALHYVYRTSTVDGTRQLAMLQCAAFIAMFHRLVGDTHEEIRLDMLEPLLLEGTLAEAVDEIFADVPERRERASRKTLAYLSSGADEVALVARARHYLAHNVTQAHDYKYAEAAFENAAHTESQPWRARLLAAAMAYLRGPARRRPIPAVDEAAVLLRG